MVPKKPPKRKPPAARAKPKAVRKMVAKPPTETHVCSVCGKEADPCPQHPSAPRIPRSAWREPIRDHGDIVTAPAGTTEGQVAAKLAGIEDVPSLEELGKAKAPPWDPHAGHEVAPGREFGGEPEVMISTLVFIGVDRGGDFEDRVQSLVTLAETLEFKYVTATIGKFHMDAHLDNLDVIADEVQPEPDDEPDVDDDDAEPVLDEEPI